MKFFFGFANSKGVEPQFHIPSLGKNLYQMWISKSLGKNDGNPRVKGVTKCALKDKGKLNSLHCLDSIVSRCFL